MRERSTRRKARRSSRLGWHMAAAFAAVGTVVAGFGGWSLNASLAGAVIAPGRIVVDGNIKRVQPPIGGPVANIAVRAGDRVGAGDLLLRLDETQTRSNLNIVSAQLMELEAQRVRLRAERDGAPSLSWPIDFEGRFPGSQAARDEEERLFRLRHDLHNAQKQRMEERIQQIRLETEAISSQAKSKAREIDLIAKEKGLVDELRRKNLTNFVRPIGVDRDLARFEGDHGALKAQAARAIAQVSEIELQIVSLDQTRLSESQRELRDIDRRIEELEERRVAALDQLQRMELRAPVAGIVHDLAVHGTGAVLRPGEVAMSIVPDSGDLVAELRIRPQDIDQVQPGQHTRLRFSAFNQRTTPELDGRIVRVAADLLKDERTGEPYYTAAVRVGEDQLARLGSMKLVPGMPAEAFISTGERTLASYLLKPLTDQMNRALREE